MKNKKMIALLTAVVMIGGCFAGCGGNSQSENKDSADESSANEESADESSANEESADEGSADEEQPDEEQAGEPAESEDSGSGDKTITVSVHADTGKQEGWEAVADAYMEMHPDVNVVIDLKPADGYDQWVQNVFISNDTTDVDLVSINYGGGVENGKYIDWSTYADTQSPYSDGPWKDQYQYDMQLFTGANGQLKSLCLESTQVMWFYNQDIFDEVGVEVPTTWDELIDVCEKIQQAGYQPIAVGGDYESFYTLDMGWLAQIYADQTTRSSVELWRSQEGDYTYDPDIDGQWTYDPTDPWNDDPIYVTANISRFYKSVHDGEYTANTPGMKTVWNNFAKVFPKYAGNDAMFGTNKDGAKTLFYQGKAAMMVDGGWGIVEFANNMKAISNGETLSFNDAVVEDAETFTLGTFAMPTMEGEGIEAPARTIEVVNGYLGAVSKSQEHDDLVVDFVMYYSSAEGMSKYLDAALAAGYAPSGPSLVNGAEYPEDVANAFANIKYIGNCQKQFGTAISRGIADENESLRQFYNNAHEFLAGDIDVDEFLELQVKNHQDHLEASMENNGITLEDLENPAAEPAGIK